MQNGTGSAACGDRALVAGCAGESPPPRSSRPQLCSPFPIWTHPSSPLISDSVGSLVASTSPHPHQSMQAKHAYTHNMHVHTHTHTHAPPHKQHRVYKHPCAPVHTYRHTQTPPTHTYTYVIHMNTHIQMHTHRCQSWPRVQYILTRQTVHYSEGFTQLMGCCALPYTPKTIAHLFLPSLYSRQ